MGHKVKVNIQDRCFELTTRKSGIMRSILETWCTSNGTQILEHFSYSIGVTLAFDKAVLLDMIKSSDLDPLTPQKHCILILYKGNYLEKSENGGSNWKIDKDSLTVQDIIYEYWNFVVPLTETDLSNYQERHRWSDFH